MCHPCNCPQCVGLMNSNALVMLGLAVKEALLELGVITDHGRPPYDTEPSHN